MGHTHKREQTPTLGGEPMTAENTADAGAPDTIVLIHGLWVTPRSWEKWVERYEGKGYRVLAPAYRGFDYPCCSRAPREHRKRAREPPDHHGPLGRRSVYPDPPRPRLRCSGSCHRLRACRGCQGNSALTDQGLLPDPQEPGQPP